MASSGDHLRENNNNNREGKKRRGGPKGPRQINSKRSGGPSVPIKKKGEADPPPIRSKEREKEWRSKKGKEEAEKDGQQSRQWGKRK